MGRVNMTMKKALASLSLLLWVGAGQAATLGLTPEQVEVDFEDPISFTVSTDDFPTFLGGGFAVEYDADVLELVSFVPDDTFNLLFVPDVTPLAGLTISPDIAVLSKTFFQQFSGDVTLGTLNFTARRVETTTQVQLRPAANQSGAGFQDPTFQILTGIDYAGAILKVNDPNGAVADPVPLPAGGLLFLTGGAALALWRRWKLSVAPVK